jgi:hypothetical protein
MLQILERLHLSYPRKAMDTIDVENVGPETIKDEDGRECIESAPSTVQV